MPGANRSGLGGCPLGSEPAAVRDQALTIASLEQTGHRLTFLIEAAVFPLDELLVDDFALLNRSSRRKLL